MSQPQPQPQQQFDFGAVHGAWRSVGILGKGAFSCAVHRVAKVSSPTITAAVKVINIAAMKPEERRSAEQEVAIMARLSGGGSSGGRPHPHIVRYFSSYERNGMLYILLELCSTDLARVLEKRVADKRGPLDEAVIGRLVAQLASALSFLHEKPRRILHRDIKTANIFLQHSGSSSFSSSSSEIDLATATVKLGDFGISTVLRHTHALAKTQCGSPYWFSPELVLNKPYSNKSDTWALGVVLYELATLRKAFDGRNLKALMQRILKGSYDAVSATHYSASLQALIDGMLQQKVDRRMSMRQVMASEFVRRYAPPLPGGSTAGGGAASGDAALASPQQPAATKQQQQQQQRQRQLVHQQRLQRQQQQDANTARAHGQRVAALNNRPHPPPPRLAANVEPMKYIARRCEMEAYEDQQIYVDRGRRVVARVRAAQEQRQHVRDTRSSRIAELRRKLEEIEARHNQLRNEREQQRARELYEYHRPQVGGGRAQFLQQQPAEEQSASTSDSGAAPRAEPTAAELANFYRARNLGHAGQRLAAPTVVPRGAVIAPSAVRADTHFGGRRELEDLSDSAWLAAAAQHQQGQRQPGGEGDDGIGGGDRESAARLWELQRARIEAARQLEQLQSRRRTQTGEGDAEEDDDEEGEEEEEENGEEEEHEEEEEDDDDEAVAESRVRMSQQQRQQPQPPPASRLFNPAYDPAAERYDNRTLQLQQEQQRQQQQEQDDDDDYFEEEALPANVISTTSKMMERKFMLDGRTLKLPGVTGESSDAARAAALREFLVEGLGGSRELFDDIYGRLIAVEQIEELDRAEEAMQLLEQSLGEKCVRLLDLMIQLRVVEQQM